MTTVTNIPSVGKLKCSLKLTRAAMSGDRSATRWRGDLIKCIVARKWFFACILACIATLSTKYAAENQAWKAASTLTLAAQDVADGKASVISPSDHRQAMAHARFADLAHLAG